MNSKSSRAFSVRNLVLTSLFICLGILIPFVAGHASGIPGNVLLPMHLAIFLAGLICGPRYGAICGFITPILSSLLTGMPPVWPMLPIMIAELTTYGFVSGLTYKRFKLPIYLSLPVSMVVGRIVYGIVFSGITLVSAAPLKAASVITAVITGLPGIVIQLILVPVIVKAVERYQGTRTSADLPAASGLNNAIKEIASGANSCILVKDGDIIHRDSGRGVSPLIRLYESPDGKIKLKDAVVADKIIGKGAAVILVLGGAKIAYGELMSEAGRKYLEENNISYKYGRCVDFISSRDGKGMCPIEKSVMDISDPQEAYEIIKKTIDVLMGKVAN